MKKSAYIPLLTAAMMFNLAAENSTEAAFPSEVVVEKQAEQPKPTTLTEEEKSQANKNIKAAVATYNDIIDSQAGSRLKTIEKNLLFIEKTIKQLTKDIEVTTGKLDKMKLEVVSRSKVIDKLEVAKEVKDKKKRELHLLFEEKNEYLSFSIESYKKRLAKMIERQKILEDEKQLFVVETALNNEKRKSKEWAEIDKNRTKEADVAFKKLEKEQVEKRYQELEK